MALPIITSASGGYKAAGAPSFQFLHNVPVGIDRLLLLYVTDNAGVNPPTNPTFDGTPFTQFSGQFNLSKWYYIVAPAEIGGIIDITSGFAGGEMTAISMSIDGVDQTTPLQTATAYNIPNVTSGVPHQISSPSSLSEALFIWAWSGIPFGGGFAFSSFAVNAPEVLVAASPLGVSNLSVAGAQAGNPSGVISNRTFTFSTAPLTFRAGAVNVMPAPESSINGSGRTAQQLQNDLLLLGM